VCLSIGEISVAMYLWMYVQKILMDQFVKILHTPCSVTSNVGRDEPLSDILLLSSVESTHLMIVQTICFIKRISRADHVLHIPNVDKGSFKFITLPAITFVFVGSSSSL